MRPGRSDGGGGRQARAAVPRARESFPRVHWVAVPEALRARRVNRRRPACRRPTRSCRSAPRRRQPPPRAWSSSMIKSERRASSSASRVRGGVGRRSPLTDCARGGGGGMRCGGGGGGGSRRCTRRWPGCGWRTSWCGLASGRWVVARPARLSRRSTAHNRWGRSSLPPSPACTPPHLSVCA
jgi:hypothetical protein